MNKYYCIKCEEESVIRSIEPVLDYKCSCDPKPTKYRLVSLKDKPNPPAAPVKKQFILEVEPTAATPPSKPKLTRLDVSTGTSQM